MGSQQRPFARWRTDAVHGCLVSERLHHSLCGECPNVVLQQQTLSSHKVHSFSCWPGSAVKVQMSFGSIEGLLSF